jgi:hypothetical protein
VRISVVLAAAVAVLGASLASAASAPTYTITFSGGGSEHQFDTKRNVEDDGECYAAEHVDVTATFAWSTSWRGFNLTTRHLVAPSSQTAGSSVVGSHVKDSCGEPLDEAPEGWVSQASCNAPLAVAGSPELSRVKTTATSVLLAITAPSFAVPGSVECPLIVRNDQLVLHLAVPLKRLQTLKKGASLAFGVGTARPGPSDLYAPTLDCSRPTKPYEGYRIDDHCEDALTWSGSVKITRG